MHDNRTITLTILQHFIRQYKCEIMFLLYYVIIKGKKKLFYKCIVNKYTKYILHSLFILKDLKKNNFNLYTFLFPILAKISILIIMSLYRRKMYIILYRSYLDFLYTLQV